MLAKNRNISIKKETHRDVYIRFIAVLVTFIAYFVFVSRQYGVGEGWLIAWLSWSFFVLCTPIADAGMLIDFPVRLITGLKMVISESLVWATAIGLNTYMLLRNPQIYANTELLKLFYHILATPWPLWGIIALSFVGTFLSITIGDELLDVFRHKDRQLHIRHGLKLRLITMAFILIFTLVLYDYILNLNGITINKA